MFTKKNIVLSLIILSIVYILYRKFITIEPFASDFTFNEVTSVPSGSHLSQFGRDNSVKVTTKQDSITIVELPARVRVKEWNYKSANGRPYKMPKIIGHDNIKTILAIQSNILASNRETTLVFTRV